MPKMRCKVYVSSLSHAYNNGVSVTFCPVTSGSEENKRFHNATPSGNFQATLSAEAAKMLGTFELGKEYFVDFIPAANNTESCSASSCCKDN